MGENLEKRAEKNILQSIDKLVVNSLLMLLFEGLVIEKHALIKDIKKYKEVKELIDYFFETLTAFKQITDCDAAAREEKVKKIFEAREKLLDIYDSLMVYFSACNIVDLCLEGNILEKDKEEHEKSELDDLKTLLSRKTAIFMDKAKKYDIEDQASAILFTVLPNYLTDKELVDYITYSAGFYFENSDYRTSLLHIKLIKRSFAPQKTSDYGKHFKKEGESLGQIIEEIRLKGLKDLDKLTAKYEAAYNRIEGFSEIISGLYSGFSYMLIMLAPAFKFDDIVSRNFVYEDYFNKTLELIRAEDFDEALTETLLNSLDENIEKEMNELSELARRKELIYRNVNFEKFSNSTKTALSLELFMTTTFYENIEETVDGLDILGDNEFVSPKTVKKEIKELQNYIRENSLGMNETLKSSARRNLFFSVPLASNYNKDMMMQYIERLCETEELYSEIEESLETVNKLLEDETLAKLSSLEE